MSSTPITQSSEPAIDGTQQMRAATQDRYGPPTRLRITEVAKPVPGPEGVLVRVAAASVNARDWHVMRGEPRIARLMAPSIFGLRRPTVPIRGTDFAGVVEATGNEVTELRPGDRVFGEADGAFAEYVTAPVDHIARVPDGVSVEQAAAAPLAGTTALECLRAADPRAGSRVLVNGASGGVGTFVVQLAKAMDLHVTAVCSSRNADQARALGADAVIDYTRDDFTATAARHDVVIDLVGNRSLPDLRRAVVPGGDLVVSGWGVPGQGRYVGSTGILIRSQLPRAGRSSTAVRVHTPQAKPSTGVLRELAQLLADGVIGVVRDRTFPLRDVATALRYMEDDHPSGKVVITIDTAILTERSADDAGPVD